MLAEPGEIVKELAVRAGIEVTAIRAGFKQTGEILFEKFAHLPATSTTDHRVLERTYWHEFIEYSKGQTSTGGNEGNDEENRNNSPDFFIDHTDSYITAVPGMVGRMPGESPLLEHLQANGIRLALCSDNTEFWFRRQMGKFDLYRFFPEDRTILSCHIGKSKSSGSFER